MTKHPNFTKFRDEVLEDLEIEEAYRKADERLKLCDDQFEQLEANWLGIDMYGDD